MPLGSQVAPPSPTIAPPPVEEVVTLIEDYASGDEGRIGAALSLVCKRQINFVDKPYVLEAPQLLVQEELQQTKDAIEIPPSIPLVDSSFVPSSDPTTVQSVSKLAESFIPAIVQLQPEVFTDIVFPLSPPHIVQIGVEEIDSFVVSSLTPLVSEHIEKVPIPEEHIKEVHVSIP